jgi:hypothetical protein
MFRKFNILCVALVVIFITGCTNIIDTMKNGQVNESLKMINSLNNEDINKKYNGVYPLEYAINHNKEKVAVALIKKGADLKLNYNTTLLDKSLVMSEYQVSKLLIKKGVILKDPNKTFKKIIEEKNYQSIKLILDNFPNLNKKLISIILKNNNIDIIEFLLKNKYINQEQIKDVIENFIDNLSLMKSISDKYPNMRTYLLKQAIANNNKLLIEFVLSKKVKIDKIILIKVSKTKNIDIINMFVKNKNGKKLKNTYEYKKLLKLLTKMKKNQEVIKKWNRYTHQKITNFFTLKGKFIELKKQNVNLDIKKRANNILIFMDSLLKITHNPNKIKKLLLYKTFEYTDWISQRSGPCFLGICAGFNKATANIKIKLEKLSSKDTGIFKITNLSISRNSESSYNVYNKLVQALKNKYSIGDKISLNIPTAINITMWNLYKKKENPSRYGWSKRNIADIGIYMLEAIHTKEAADTGAHLVYDYLNCDAGVMAEKMIVDIENVPEYKDTLKNMQKKCGWDKIK